MGALLPRREHRRLLRRRPLPSGSRGQDPRGDGARNRGDRGGRRGLLGSRQLRRRLERNPSGQDAQGAPRQVLRRAARRHVRGDRLEGGDLRSPSRGAEPQPGYAAAAGEGVREPGPRGVQDPRQRRVSSRTRSRGIACLAVAALALLPAQAAADAKPAAQPPELSAAAWILVDAGDRTRLGAHDPNSSRAMASTTKLMTAYLALHRLPLKRQVTAPAYHPIPGESLLGLEPGERMSVRDLLYGLLLPSGNDAAVTLADGVAGSTVAFAQDMNRAARHLGLDET